VHIDVLGAKLLQWNFTEMNNVSSDTSHYLECCHRLAAESASAEDEAVGRYGDECNTVSPPPMLGARGGRNAVDSNSWFSLLADSLSSNLKKKSSSSLDTAPLTIPDSGALQPQKWQLTGINCSTMHRHWQPRVRANGLLGPQLQPAGILRPSQPQ